MNSLDFLFDFIVSKDNPLTRNLQPLHPATSSPRPLELRMPGPASTESAPIRPPLIHHNHHHQQPPTHHPPRLANYNAHLPPNEHNLIVFTTSAHTPSEIPIEWIPTPHAPHWQDDLLDPPYQLPCGHHPDQLCCCSFPPIIDDCSFGWTESLVWGGHEQVPHLQLGPQMGYRYQDGYGANGQSGFHAVVYYTNPDPEPARGYGGGGRYGIVEGMQGEREGGFVLRSCGTLEAERGVLRL